MNLVSPSLLAADFCSLSQEISRVDNAPWLHIDVMDGHFVSNISIGVPVVEAIRRATDKFLDVHLMIEDPAFFAPVFANAGADLLCFHIEAALAPIAVIKVIRGCKKKVGIALRPQTPISAVLPFLGFIDMVLVMAVEPGKGGQSFMPDTLQKLCDLRTAIKEKGFEVDIQVDGGVTPENAWMCVKAGANILVAGTAIFGNENPSRAVEILANAGESSV